MALRNFLKPRVLVCSLRQLSSQPKYVSLTLDDKTGISVLQLQRPPVNSLNSELLNEINTALIETGKNQSRGLILTSKNDGVFSAGLDILEMYKPDENRLRQFWSALQDVWINLYGSAYPTVAVINGHAPAGGCLLAMSCEYRVMMKNKTIGLNETQLGIVAPKWFIATMENTIGRRKTELCLTAGRMLTTDQALDINLVDESVDSTEMGMAKAHEFLQQFKAIPKLARSVTKQYIRGATVESLTKTRQEDLDGFVQFCLQPDVQKSLGFYLEMLKKKSAK